MRFGQSTTADKPWLQRKAVKLYCRGCFALSRLLGRLSNGLHDHGQTTEVKWGPVLTYAERVAVGNARYEASAKRLKELREEGYWL